jgi:hypothetical protein
MSQKTWIAEGAVTLPLSPVTRVTRVVEEYRVWLFADEDGSWVAIHEDPVPRRDRKVLPIGLWGSYPTREEALRAVWEAEQQLRAMGTDRRKNDRRRHMRLRPDRRATVESQVWTLVE